MSRPRLRYLAEDLVIVGMLLGICALIVFGPQSQLSSRENAAEAQLKTECRQNLR